MSTQLTPEVEKIIHERLAKGDYRSANELIEDALVALEEREHRESLLAALAEGDADFERGACGALDADQLDAFVEDIKRRGLARLTQQ
jgi:antitoxin ParD1/3/4